MKVKAPVGVYQVRQLLARMRREPVEPLSAERAAALSDRVTNAIERLRTRGRQGYRQMRRRHADHK